MKVAIDALGIDRPGGGRSATLNLLVPLFTLDRTNCYVVFVSRPEQSISGWPNVHQCVLGPLPALASRVWAQVIIPLYVRRWRADLVHHVKNLTVAGQQCPSIVTVYDLTILHHPDLYPRIDVWYWRHVQPRALRNASRIIAISRTTARDLTRFYKLDSERIEIIYPSYAAAFSPGSGSPDSVRRRYGIAGDFILHVGSISRKKNLLTLLRAFHRLRQRGLAIKLVLAGRLYQKGHDASLPKFLAGNEFASDVIFTGPVPEEDLPGLYRAASALAFPSLHEGFGIVPLEAMACGVPVVSSPGGALEEVIENGGWLLRDPSDDAELADALEMVLRDQRCRNELIERGLVRSAAFSPDRTALQTLDLYERVASRRSGPAPT